MKQILSITHYKDTSLFLDSGKADNVLNLSLEEAVLCLMH